MPEDNTTKSERYPKLCLPLQPSESEVLKSTSSNKQLWVKAMVACILMISITSISYVLMYELPWTKQPPQTVNSASNQQVHPVEFFRKELKDLKSKFIAQDTDFWKRIKVPVLRVIREEDPDYPAVVLLVVPKGESTSKTATCLAKQYRSIIGKVYTGGKIPEKGYINVQTISKSSLEDSKYLLDHEIIELFNSSKSDNNAVVTDHIEDLDPNVMMLFSGYCDGNHAPYKKAVFVFVLHTDLEIKALRNLDKTVDHYLQTLWGKNLDNDKIPNLIARVANNKALIHEENISSLTLSGC